MGADFQLALIVPASNTVMEPDLHRHAASEWVTSTWRILLESVTREAETKMLHEELPTTLGRIVTTRPDVVFFGCTSAGSLGGLEHDAELAKRIEAETGSPAATVLRAVVDELEAAKPGAVAVFTPYIEELTASVASCITEAGFPPVRARGMGLRDNRAIGRVTPQEIAAFVLENLGGIEPDAVLLSCTNWQAVDAIAPLKERLGVPVLSSNAAAIRSVRNLAADIRALGSVGT